jgi:hypothetical protein
VGTYAHNTMFWAIDSVGAAFTAGGWVSIVSGAVCVLYGALDMVSEAVAVGSIGVGGCDMATAGCGSGCGQGCWGLGWGAVGQLGSICHHF